MNKYQYDDEYFIAEEANLFVKMLSIEEEIAYARYLQRRK